MCRKWRAGRTPRKKMNQVFVAQQGTFLDVQNVSKNIFFLALCWRCIWPFFMHGYNITYCMWFLGRRINPCSNFNIPVGKCLAGHLVFKLMQLHGRLISDLHFLTQTWTGLVIVRKCNISQWNYLIYIDFFLIGPVIDQSVWETRAMIIQHRGSYRSFLVMLHPSTYKLTLLCGSINCSTKEEYLTESNETGVDGRLRNLLSKLYDLIVLLATDSNVAFTM